VFNWAVKEKLLSQNPIKGMERPRQQSRDSFASDEEVQALLRGAAPAFRLFLLAPRKFVNLRGIRRMMTAGYSRSIRR
jgi:hypothetical protein